MTLSENLLTMNKSLFHNKSALYFLKHGNSQSGSDYLRGADLSRRVTADPFRVIDELTFNGYMFDTSSFLILLFLSRDELIALRNDIVDFFNNRNAYARYDTLYKELPTEGDGDDAYVISSLEKHFDMDLCRVLKDDGSVSLSLLARAIHNGDAKLLSNNCKTIKLVGFGEMTRLFNELIVSKDMLYSTDLDFLNAYIGAYGGVPFQMPEKFNHQYTQSLVLERSLRYQILPYDLVKQYLTTPSDILWLATGFGRESPVESLEQRINFNIRPNEAYFVLSSLDSIDGTVDEMLPHGDIWMDLIEHIQPEKFKFKYPKAATLVNRFMIEHKKINKAPSC